MPLPDGRARDLYLDNYNAYKVTEDIKNALHKSRTVTQIFSILCN